MYPPLEELASISPLLMNRFPLQLIASVWGQARLCRGGGVRFRLPPTLRPSRIQDAELRDTRGGEEGVNRGGTKALKRSLCHLLCCHSAGDESQHGGVGPAGLWS